MGRSADAKEMAGSFSGRTYLWLECLRDAVNNPIFGYGYNSFLGPKNINRIADKVGWTPNSPHSAYVDTTVGLGFVGLFVLVAILYLAWRDASRLAAKNPDYTFVMAVMVWLIFNAILEADPISGPTFATYYCMVLIAKLAFIAPEDNRQGVLRR